MILKGGHIKGALNVFNPNKLKEIFFGSFKN
jgi:hypothetical protein